MDIIAPIKITNDMQDVGAPVFRASANGTYWDKDGVLRTAPIDTPRITYDPADLSAAPYLLLEPGATNLCPFSAYFSFASGAGWNDNGGAVVTAAYGIAPDGTQSTSLISVANGGATRYRNISGLTVGARYTFSEFVRPLSATAVMLFMDGIGGGSITATFDVPTRTFSNVTAGCTTGFQVCPGGMLRPWIAFTAPTSNINAHLYLNAGAMEFWGVQIEPGEKPSSYIPTAGAPATRNGDQLNPAVGNGLLWSNVPENVTYDGNPWSSGPAYTAGTKVRRPNHRTYLALQDNTNKTPEDNTIGATPIWQDVGPTRRWSVFDNKYSTIASAAEVVQYLIRPGAIATAVGALGIEGNDVRVSVVDANTGTLVYRNTKSQRIKNSRSISDYCFKPIARRRDEVFDDLPPFKNCIICVTVTKKASVAQVADIVVGRLEYAGETQWAPEIRSKRRSIVTDNGFGDLTFTKRRKSKLLTVDVAVENNLVDDTVRLIDAYTDEPCVIIGDARWTSLIILGFITDFRLVLESPAGSLYNAQIEGFA